MSYQKNIAKAKPLCGILQISTFSIDVDTASYSNFRRFVTMGSFPKSGSIRTEELLNYFDYDASKPENGEMFGVKTEIGKCPWQTEHNLAMIQIKGKEATEQLPSHFVFLIDISGSMYAQNKLPLLKKLLMMLVEQMKEEDKISIVTYASGTNVVLSGESDHEKIKKALDSLTAGGSTNGTGGLQLAYEQAEKLNENGNNRIILCTDGDFNVGIQDTNSLKKYIEEKRKSHIYLSVLGFGIGTYQDDKLEVLADNGNGGYYYIDSLKEAQRVLVQNMTKKMYTIADDVKLQVEFNPDFVKEYRLIGYENRMMNQEDFQNDNKDAGELGAGGGVTAIYEIVSADGEKADVLRYTKSESNHIDEIMNIKIRYKNAGETESIEKEYPIQSGLEKTPSTDFLFASAVSELGMLLNNSENKGSATYDTVINLARAGLGEDSYGIRNEFLHMADLMRYICLFQ